MAVDRSHQYLLKQHRGWLGEIQPVGLVVAPIALANAGAQIDRDRTLEAQLQLRGIVSNEPHPRLQDGESWVEDFVTFASEVLNWYESDLVPPTPELQAALPDYGETLVPDYVVMDSLAPDKPLLLVKNLPTGTDLDRKAGDDRGWSATPQEKFERLLRETEIGIGLLFNGVTLRLVYAPRGESSGYLHFPVAPMLEVPGRSLLGALVMLLDGEGLFIQNPDFASKRLPTLLAASRKAQNSVTERLSEQVLDALWELLRGFQAADADAKGRVLGTLGDTDPQHIYGGLVTALMRLVFLLYAEERQIMPEDELYQRNYSVVGLYEKLRRDAGNYPDTMDRRYGAWAWLLSLFRLVYDGGGATEDYLPARDGQLFDPDEYPFLEGRARVERYCQCDADGKLVLNERGERIPLPVEFVPRVPDGTVFRILDRMLVVEGERLTYRALDVEHIGSVYEGIMGFEVERAKALSIAVSSKPGTSKVTVPVVVDLEALLATAPKDRKDRLKQWANCEISAKVNNAVKDAKTIDELVAALGPKLSAKTPAPLPVGSLYLQPGEERRRTGSHYTPRSLTEPIVRDTLRPIWERLGEHPTVDEVLELKVCDLAMGSGAFLVELCRQLADRVVAAWDREEGKNEDEDTDRVLAARRLVAQKCLYGVDKNPFAVNLAKLSLWLFTLAKDRPFTFLDHALKCGDSLVGLTREEIESFVPELPLLEWLERVDRARVARSDIQAGDVETDADEARKREQLRQAEAEIAEARLLADVRIAAFFDGGTKKKQRQEKLKEYANLAFESLRNRDYQRLTEISQELQRKERMFPPFSWALEFPEVFDRDNPGFDAIAGNPPFAGKNTIAAGHTDGYLDYLKGAYPESHGNSDHVAYFFRRAFSLVRQSGTLGLIATNTIAQGDTRSTGLRFICNDGGTIYHAKKRLKWPGLAAVVVSVLQIYKGNHRIEKRLDGRLAEHISAFLFDSQNDEDPKVLAANAGKSFIGSYVLGMGFTFDDTNEDATTIAEMHRLIEKDPRNQERIFPYIGGEEVNSSPTHAHHRYVINFGEMSEEEAREWPDLMAIVEEKVKSQRVALPPKNNWNRTVAKRWWLFGADRKELSEVTSQLVDKAPPEEQRVLVNSQVSARHGLAFLPANYVYAHTLNVFLFHSYRAFAALQSSPHELWARFFGSSMKDDLRYTPSSCFETFPFPEVWEINPDLEAIGEIYYQYRAELMVRHSQGLTDTYNRFHDPAETDPEILHLRELHGEMDAAVLNAYGWTDLDTTCGFSLDYLDLDDEQLSQLPEDFKTRIETQDFWFADPAEAVNFDVRVKQVAGSKRKLPWRYRWRDTTRDDMLARLLELNQQRHEAEVLMAKREAVTQKPARKSKRKRKAEKTATQTSLQLR